MARLDGWRYCPLCAGALAALPGRVECGVCGFVSWANAAPTVSALIEDGAGRLLLGRRAREPFLGRWDTPGGYLEEAEHPLAALVREVREETGLEVVPEAYFGCWTDVYGEPGDGVIHTLNLFWRARLLGSAGAARPGDDIAELRWFGRHELPSAGDLAFACVPQALAAWQDDASPA